MMQRLLRVMGCSSDCRSVNPSPLAAIAMCQSIRNTHSGINPPSAPHNSLQARNEGQTAHYVIAMPFLETTAIEKLLVVGFEKQWFRNFCCGVNVKRKRKEEGEQPQRCCDGNQ